tara:strand:+ start:1091 stop:2425 length:1335 start_codon:yes stop_codon:yes gene_type:complete
MATNKSLVTGNSDGASGILYTDRRDFYIDPQVTKELWTDVTPFTTMISNKETRQTNDPLFKMFEHRNPWIKQEFQAASNPASLPDGNDESDTLTIDNIQGLASDADSSYVNLVCEVWDSTKTTKKGTAVISSVSSGTELKYKNLNKGSALDVANDDFFIVIGNAHGEGSSAPDAWSDELEVVWNSCQIFKTPLQVTGTLLQAALRGESSELARLRLQKSQEHKMQKERAFLFGSRVGGTGLDLQDGSSSDSFADGGRKDANNNLIRSTYGIVNAILDYGSSDNTQDYCNIFTVDSSYAYSNFVDDMEKVFQYVPEVGVKRAFVGAGALGYWSKMAGTSGLTGNSGWTVNLSDMKRDSLGFNYRILETPHGILQLIPTPALRGPYNKYMLVVDDSNLFHAQYRSMMYQTNIKTDNAFDGVKDQYFSDEGVGISLIESHNLFKITA